MSEIGCLVGTYWVSERRMNMLFINTVVTYATHFINQ
jgi:hypothetical protein